MKLLLVKPFKLACDRLLEEMYATGLKCVNCGSIFPLQPEYFVCPKCGVEKVNDVSLFKGITEVQYNYEAIAESISKEKLSKRPFNALRYRELLDLDGKVLTLGEGGTSLIRCNRLSERLGLNNLLLKNETQNPTHSFKDRETFLAINKALEFGAKYVSCVSSGNASSSLAAYAAKAGLGCFVFMPATTSEGKISQCTLYGATTFLLPGIYEEIFEVYLEAVKGLGIFESTPGHNRFRVEGDKTIAYEICEQLGWKAPDWVIDNVGNGTHLYGMWKGFKEMKKLGFIEELPRMAATGPVGGAPIVEGFRKGKASPLERSRKSIAEGLVSKWSYDAPLALKALKESNGYAEYVSDEEIVEAIKLLAQFEGLFAEPSGAACVAALSKMMQNGIVDKKEKVVCIITGSGLKDPVTTRKIAGSPVRISLDVSKVKEALKNKVK